MPKSKKTHASNSKKKAAPKHGTFSGERSQWSGSITFGLINIPVKMQTAVREKGIRFSLFREKDHCKIRRKFVCETDKKEVAQSEIVKGYEVEEGRHVMLHEEEIEQLAPKSAREIVLSQFCDLKEIDPLYFSRPYYLVPQKNGKRSYALFVEALKKSGQIGIGKMVIRNKQYLTALRVYQDVICLETLHFSDEVLAPPQVELSGSSPSAKEIETARKLIESLSEKFEPEKLHDDYRETLLKMLHEKKAVRTTVAKAKKSKAEEGGAEIVDLMAALEASLQQSKKKKAA